MHIIENTTEFQLDRPGAVAIGKFDGIHRGHRLLLQEAAKANLTTVMFTFSAGENSVLYVPHVLSIRSVPKRLVYNIIMAITCQAFFSKILKFF